MPFEAFPKVMYSYMSAGNDSQAFGPALSISIAMVSLDPRRSKEVC